MVCEVALVEIQDGANEAYEAAVRKGVENLLNAKGFISLRWMRSVDNPNRYRLILDWEHIDNHRFDFVQSPAFEVWRSLVLPHFTARPSVEYFEELDYRSA